MLSTSLPSGSRQCSVEMSIHTPLTHVL
jgi:hypothetical protein